jgi:hypothetical protein
MEMFGAAVLGLVGIVLKLLLILALCGVVWRAGRSRLVRSRQRPI